MNVPVRMAAVDLRRLLDATIAVQAGTWQPTPTPQETP